METHVASACFLMHESTLLYLTQFGYLNCLIRTGHSRTYKYTAAQSTTQCLQICKSTCAFQRDLSQSLCTSQAQRMRGLLHPPPPSQRWKKGLDKLKQLFSSNCIIVVNMLDVGFLSFATLLTRHYVVLYCFIRPSFRAGV